MYFFERHADIRVLMGNRFVLFALPLLLSLFVLWICYPGFMSYDSIRMLEEARSSVMGDPFPAMPVYILRLFDFAGNGPVLMLQAQNFVLLLSFMMILQKLGASLIVSTKALLALLAMPTVIGCMLVLWKDVTLTSLIMASVALIFCASQTAYWDNRTLSFRVAKWVSLLLLMIGTLVRLNAITATAVITIYWIVVFCSGQGWKIKGTTFITILICMVASDRVINNYSFPDLNKLPSNTVIYGVMTYDLVGISHWSRISLLPIKLVDAEVLSKASISDIDRIYSPLGIVAMNSTNAAQGDVVHLYATKYSNEDIVKAWLGAVYNHPLAYIRYRVDLFAEIIGAKFHGTYEPTHFNKIDKNQFDITFQDRTVTKLMIGYIWVASNSFIGKPWFVFLLSAVALLKVHKNSLICTEIKMLSYFSFFAAMLYMAPFFIISGTGEVRYCLPAIALSSVSIFVWFFVHNRVKYDGKIKT